jgi:hypothetical protein
MFDVERQILKNRDGKIIVDHDMIRFRIRMKNV